MYVIKMSEAAAETSPAEKLQSAMEGLGGTETTPVVDTPSPQVTEATPPVSDPTPVATNPAWNDILSSVPEVLHSTLTPKLKEWDAGVQKQFEKYKPYEEFVNTDPTQLKNAMQLFQTLQTDPRRVYEQLGAHLGVTPQQAQQIVENEEVDLGENDDEEVFDDPRLVELQQGQQQIKSFLAQQQAAQEAAASERWLDEQQKTIAKKFEGTGIEPDFQMILATAAGLTGAGMEPNAAMNQAVSNFEQFVSKYRPRANDSAPLLMPPGGGTPVTTPIKPAEMDEKTLKRYATQLLEQSFRGL